MKKHFLMMLLNIKTIFLVNVLLGIGVNPIGKVVGELF